jgi:peptide/nickel transport system permease protein
MAAVALRRRFSPLRLNLPATSRGVAIALASLPAIVTVLVLLAPVLAPYNPVQPIGDLDLPPLSPHFLLGTDAVGRDLLSRTLLGMRASWLSSLAVVAIGLAFGGLVGVVAGAAGGWVDGLLMRLTDLFLALPGALVAIAIVSALGPGLVHTLIGISVVWWPYYARILRAEVRALAIRPHVEAARLSGAGRFRIVIRHLLPGAIPTAVVTASLDIGNVVLLLAGLSFLGLGSPEPSPELGADVSAGLDQLISQWWVPIIPGLAVLLLSLVANVGGDALRRLLGDQR